MTMGRTAPEGQPASPEQGQNGGYRLAMVSFDLCRLDRRRPSGWCCARERTDRVLGVRIHVADLLWSVRAWDLDPPADMLDVSRLSNHLRRARGRGVGTRRRWCRRPTGPQTRGECLRPSSRSAARPRPF